MKKKVEFDTISLDILERYGTEGMGQTRREVFYARVNMPLMLPPSRGTGDLMETSTPIRLINVQGRDVRNP